jgi:BCD family chlorophyll transporter-like MFS transporter
VGGCLASAVALAALAVGGQAAPDWPLRTNVFALGAANGAFAVAAIGSMMSLAGASRPGSEGIRMGLWGAAQAIAFAAGGLVGTGAADLARAALGSPAAAYGVVFLAEAVLFLVAAQMAARVVARSAATATADAGHRVVAEAPPQQALARAWGMR